MTDWKMPILPIPATLALRLEDLLRAEEYPAGKNSASHIDWLLKKLCELRFFSTPSERDEQDKRIVELDEMLTRQIDFNIEMENKKIKLHAITVKQDKRIAKLKSALDNAEKENNAAWVLNEKLKSGGQQKRIKELEEGIRKSKSILHIKNSTISNLMEQLSRQDERIEELEAEVKRLQGKWRELQGYDE